MEAYLQIAGVSKTYDSQTKPALQTTNLEVHKGEFLVLVGPSGCGKTTLLRLLAGLEIASSGSLRLDGRDVTALAPRDRDVAMVFQGYALYPHMTVRENLSFGLRMRHMTKRHIMDKVSSTAELLGIGDLLDRRPAQLSGGQQQRVALGRAIVREPKLFLFDEPLSNLDAALRSSTRAELVKLHRELGATSIYVTHDQTEAMSMGDRLVVMSGGVIQQIGSPIDIYRKPANRFVAEFIGHPPMNVLRFQADETGTAVTFDGVSLPLADGVAVQPNAPVCVGFRPEHFRVGSPFGLQAQIKLVEQLGNESLLLCDVGGQEVTVRYLQQSIIPHPGEILRLQPCMEYATFFSPETGDVLTLQPRSSDSFHEPALQKYKYQ